MQFVRETFPKQLMCARTLDVYREVLAENPVRHAGNDSSPGGQVAA